MAVNIFPILAPVSGRINAVDEYSSVFSHNRLFGSGPTVEVSSNRLVAPFAGHIKDISSSGDFLRLDSGSGVQLTLMFGNGNCFQIHPSLIRHVHGGAEVSQGQPLLTLNQSLLRASDPQHRRLSILLASSAGPLKAVSWPTTGTLNLLESVIFEKESETS